MPLSTSPSVVLCIEQEVGADDGDTDSDHNHDDKYQQHETKHIVDFVLPEGSEDEVTAWNTQISVF